MVTPRVCGMRATVKVACTSSTLATVRLIPSTAMEPFSTAKGGSSFGSSITTSRPAATPFIALILLVASTWPWTRWPSSNREAASGSSRLTRAPSFSAPRFVRRSVSGTTSATKIEPDFVTTVKQHPLTATLEPTFRRRAAEACSMPSLFASASTTVPTPLTIPVNIHVPRDQYLVSKLRRVCLAQPDRIHKVQHAPAAHRSRCVATPDHDRCAIILNLIHETGAEECCVDLASTLEKRAQRSRLSQRAPHQGRVGPALSGWV